jgi:hypothetical protein
MTFAVAFSSGCNPLFTVFTINTVNAINVIRLVARGIRRGVICFAAGMNTKTPKSQIISAANRFVTIGDK